MHVYRKCTNAAPFNCSDVYAQTVDVRRLQLQNEFGISIINSRYKGKTRTENV